MMKFLAILIVFLASDVIASNLRINAVNVSGDKSAEITFVTSGEGTTPAMKVTDNIVELTFPASELAENLNGKIELIAPHALLNRVSVYSPETNTVRARIAVNGSVEALKNRLNLLKDRGRFTLSVTYPNAQNATSSLLDEEQLPLARANVDAKTKTPVISAMQMFFMLIVFILAAAVCFFVARFLKGKTSIKAPRKYLIEQMSYFALGPKTGVSLLKVGNEFVLIGVTSQSIQLLSSVPKLQAQYEDESNFDRTNFKHAVQEEFERIKTPGMI
jgi:flagellar biogenesis protein FliO